MSEDVSVERLSVAEAAEALGVTRDAIHKRIHRGSIEYEKGEDGRFYVYVDTSTQELDSSMDTSKDESRVEALERLIDNQQDRIAFLERVLEEEREARTEERRRHDTLMAQLMQRIPELEPPASSEPRESPVSPGSTRIPTDGTGGPQTATEQPSEERRGFWSRLLGR